ncbi:MAG: TonB-dependent receptor [Burkholderiales bacterium]|nr:TonB-dependent receptor [Burkholderiales bacterium]
MYLTAAAVPSALAGLALLAALPRAAAQQPAEPTLRPVVVTVTRGVAQSGFDAPASVDVIGAQTLQKGQLQVNLSESLSRVPGLVVQNRQNYAQDIQISSRGFGARSTFGVRGLRLYADGIPASGPDGQGQVSHFDIASASRIEVLRGPFSALYGNSSGGVISIFTADGGPQTVADVSTAFGSDGIRRLGVKLGGEAGKLQYTVSAARFSTDGVREHSAATRESFNAKLKYNASEDTHIALVLNSVRMPDVQDPLGLTRAELQANPRQATPSALAFNTRKSVDQAQGGLVLDQRLGGGQSLLVTAYYGERATQQFQSIPVATQAAPTQPGGVIGLARRYQGLDARWISKTRLADKPLTLTAGLSADQLREARRGFQNFTGAALGVQGALRRDEDNTVRGFDQYLQAQWEPSARWSISAGVRHASVAFDSRDRYIAAGNGDDSGAVRYQATTPALGVVFHATDSINLYAAAGRGFETPTLNELAYRASGATGLNFALQSATSRQWEAGIKSELSESWRANVAYFQARTANEIVVLSNTGGRSTFQNAGATKRDGVEAALGGSWGKGWSAQLAATWLNAVYSRGFLTCTATPCASPDSLVPAGSRIPGIPRTGLFAELAWQHRPWGLETALEWRHVGRVYVDDRNTDAAGAAGTLNLRVSLTQKPGRWTLTQFLRVDNLQNRNYSGSVIVNEGNGRYFEPAPGRNWLAGVNAAYAF